LFDYIAVDKPILFIGKGQPEQIIKEIGIGESASHDPTSIKNKLALMISSLNNYKSNENIRKCYSSEYIAKNMAKLLDKLDDDSYRES
jgi:hypothetical protein